MSLMIVEMLLWIGFALVLWAMRDDLMQTESELRRPVPSRSLSELRSRAPEPSQPQHLADPIGQYRGRTIHEYALIDGRHFRFAYVCPHAGSERLAGNQRWVSPGLVYVECSPIAREP